MKEYLPRLFDPILERSLKAMGAVLVIGPSGCGKRTTAGRLAGKVVDLGDPKVSQEAIALVKAAPRRFLA